MAKSKVLDLARELGMEDDKLLLKLKRFGVKVRDKKPTEPEKKVSLSDEKIIERDSEKEMVEKRVEKVPPKPPKKEVPRPEAIQGVNPRKETAEPKPEKEELKVPRKLVEEAAGLVTYYIIDGLNVSCWGRYPNPSFAIFLTLTFELCKRSWPFISIFDASTYGSLRVQDRQVYKDLKKSYRDFFFEVTGGMSADKMILLYANKTNGFIISNDRFREYGEKYKWIMDENSERLIKGHVTHGTLWIPDLDISVPVNRKSSDLLREITVAIKNLTPLDNINAGNKRYFA